MDLLNIFAIKIDLLIKYITINLNIFAKKTYLLTKYIIIAFWMLTIVFYPPFISLILIQKSTTNGFVRSCPVKLKAVLEETPGFVYRIFKGYP